MVMQGGFKQAINKIVQLTDWKVDHMYILQEANVDYIPFFGIKGMFKQVDPVVTKCHAEGTVAFPSRYASVGPNA